MFNPIEAIDFVVRMFQIKADLLGTSLERQVATENKIRGVINANSLPKMLFGDERRFKQVLINLVKNALKFTKNG